MKAVILALALLASMCASAEQTTGSGEAFFAAALTDLSSRPVAMEPLRGKPILLNFWARWCAPCREEFPRFQQQYVRHHKEGLLVVGVALDEHVDAVKDFARAYEIGYTVFVAGQQGVELLQALGNAPGSLPFTLALDRRGQIVARKVGAVGSEDLDAFIAKIMK